MATAERSGDYRKPCRSRSGDGELRHRPKGPYEDCGQRSVIARKGDNSLHGAQVEDAYRPVTQAADQLHLQQGDRRPKIMVVMRVEQVAGSRQSIQSGVDPSCRSGEFGPVKLMEAINTQQQGSPDQWRLKKAMAGGGSLPDIGLNASTRRAPIPGKSRPRSSPGSGAARTIRVSVRLRITSP